MVWKNINTPVLEVNLAALAANYRLLMERHAQQSIAAVVKADAYGLGMGAVARHLSDHQCRDFFVATLDEGIALRQTLPDASIGIFNGLLKGEDEAYIDYRLTPVLNDIGQVEQALKLRAIGRPLSDMLHIDTGMTRLGLTKSDIVRHQAQLVAMDWRLILSHLACAGETDHPKNHEQLQRFRQALGYFPNAKASLCNSSGLFLPQDYHFALARPGCALYGINPTMGSNPMQTVVHLSAPILQMRILDRDETLGYHATCYLPKGSRVAIAGLGYADGWPRSLSNKGHAYVAGYKTPIAGIVSMDMIALDVSAVPESLLTQETRAEFLNAQQTVDDVAHACGTIGYEILTGLGARVQRRYSHKANN